MDEAHALALLALPYHFVGVTDMVAALCVEQRHVALYAPVRHVHILSTQLDAHELPPVSERNHARGARSAERIEYNAIYRTARENARLDELRRERGEMCFGEWLRCDSPD